MNPLPEHVVVNGKKIKFAECNYYQKSIYRAIAREAHSIGQLTQQLQQLPSPELKTALAERSGVMKFLGERLVSYGALENVRESIYEDVHESCSNPA